MIFIFIVYLILFPLSPSNTPSLANLSVWFKYEVNKDRDFKLSIPIILETPDENINNDLDILKNLDKNTKQ